MTHDQSESEESREIDTAHAGETSGNVDDGDVSAVERGLAASREPYARVTVVRREAPVSANVGDRALVTADGDIHGWIGGAACAQSIVTTQAREAIGSGEPRLVGIAPDPDEVDRPGIEAFPMTCHSEGVLEVFVEPVTPTPQLVVVGDSPIARSLARLAAELTLDVTLVVAEDADRDVPAETNVLVSVDPETVADAVGRAPLVVVASMGQYDARGIAAGVLAEAPYVGVVASDDRADEEIERAAGLLDAPVETVRDAVTNPAGVDVDARTPAEIAASLLAELVDVRSRGTAADTRETADSTGETEIDEATSAEEDADDGSQVTEGATDDPDDAEEPSEAVDPVCGMTVDTQEAAATVDHDGDTYYFCCHGCADSFEADPASYLATEAGGQP